MAVTKTWEINTVERDLSDGYVTKVIYRVKGIDSSDSTEKARATGEVAPLMITGVVKLAPSMPIDSFFPYLHFERKFMHLGFHIYDVGFQSPNSEAALPMVFSTTLLLILIVITLNLTAILLRNRLKKKYKGMI